VNKSKKALRRPESHLTGQNRSTLVFRDSFQIHSKHHSKFLSDSLGSSNMADKQRTGDERKEVKIKAYQEDRGNVCAQKGGE
jgi:hypothetical protein